MYIHCVIDKAKSPAILARSGLQLSSMAQARSSKGKILRDADLVKYRAQNSLLSVSQTQSEPMPDTITVDGISRPTLNSNGKPIYPTIEGIENFWRWFDDASASRRSEASVVSDVREGEVVRGVGGLDDNARGGTAILDREGRPTVLYHGTGDSFDTFEHDHPNKNDYGVNTVLKRPMQLRWGMTPKELRNLKLTLPTISWARTR